MTQGTTAVWVGYAMSAVVVAALLADAGVQLLAPVRLEALAEGLTSIAPA